MQYSMKKSPCQEFFEKKLKKIFTFFRVSPPLLPYYTCADRQMPTPSCRCVQLPICHCVQLAICKTVIAFSLLFVMLTITSRRRGNLQNCHCVQLAICNACHYKPSAWQSPKLSLQALAAAIPHHNRTPSLSPL